MPASNRFRANAAREARQATARCTCKPQYEGLAVVTVKEGTGEERYAYIDSTGRVAITLDYAVTRNCPRNFSEGLARIDVGGRFGYIDKSGQMVIAPQYDGDCHGNNIAFSEGLAAVKLEGKWGFIDKTGRFAIAPQFSSASTFSDGLACVKFGGDKGGYIVNAMYPSQAPAAPAPASLPASTLPSAPAVEPAAKRPAPKKPAP